MRDDVYLCVILHWGSRRMMSSPEDAVLCKLTRMYRTISSLVDLPFYSCTKEKAKY
jgi:hypothetical protein